ncbi:hypothetical protein GH714_041848 [Hevea brasiliensis]|uniref:FAR1 domain-containing protein n=1 Tax=Hevea brasiliensis TaxID=3981 RepID=A0A6A6MTY6_HEVBR|nr:hypothetical protein GH714_041848 [Hevea brasiliensis]
MDGHEPDTSSYVQKEVVENELQASPAVEPDVEQEHPGSEASSVEKSLGFIQSEHDCQTREAGSSNDRRSSDAVKEEEEGYVVPKVGMEFETEDHAYKCYSRYAVLEGFSIRKDFVNKSRINGDVVSRRYTCYRQGYRPPKHIANVRKPRHETRTGCLAHMTIARQPNGKFRVTRFETQHNHEFVTPSTAHMLPSQKRLTFAQAVEADLAKGSGMDGCQNLGWALIQKIMHMNFTMICWASRF